MASPLWTTFGALALLLLVGGGAIPELGIAIYLGLVLTLMLSLIVLGFILG